MTFFRMRFIVILLNNEWETCVLLNLSTFYGKPLITLTMKRYLVGVTSNHRTSVSLRLNYLYLKAEIERKKIEIKKDKQLLWKCKALLTREGKMLMVQKKVTMYSFFWKVPWWRRGAACIVNWSTCRATTDN